MDLFAALVALGRRWYLTAALLVVLLGGTYVAAKSTKPSYKADASVIVLGPRGSGATGAIVVNTNPYLAAGPAVFANVLSRVMGSDATAHAIVKAGGTSSYTVGQGTSANGPIINIEATSSSPAVATRTATLLISAINNESVRRQQIAKVPTDAYITTQTVISGDTPSKLQGSRTRVTVAVGAMGAVLTFAAVLLVDNWLMSRRTRKRRGRKPGDGDAAGGDGSATDGSTGGTVPGSGTPFARVRP